MKKSTQTINNKGFKCPNCDSEMKLDSSSKLLCCSVCGRKDETCLNNQDTEDFDFISEETNSAANDWGLHTAVTHCDNCGAHTTVFNGEPYVTCVFCGSSKIRLTDELPGIRPASLLPFKVEKDNAMKVFSHWIKKRKMAPFTMKEKYETGNINGVYIPYWSYNAKTSSAYTGQVGDYYNDMEKYTVTSGGNTEAKTRRVQKIRWRFVSGTYDKSFSDIIFSDSAKIDEKIIKNIEPYKLNELTKYQPGSMNGFIAEHDNLGLKMVWERAKSHMAHVIQKETRDIIKRGSDVSGSLNISTNYTDIEYRHMLLPLWILAYRFHNKIYHLFINGQTGVVFGKSPKSVLKIGIITLIIAAVGVAFYFILK